MQHYLSQIDYLPLGRRIIYFYMNPILRKNKFSVRYWQSLSFKLINLTQYAESALNRISITFKEIFTG